MTDASFCCVGNSFGLRASACGTQINFADAASPNNERRPHGCDGCEIWVKIDGPLGDEKECQFLALDGNTPYLMEYDASQAGKTADYKLRWQLRDGSRSAWGETVNATITG